MLKKRKVWWKAGGFGLLTLLFAGAIVGQAYSADAKMEAKLDDIFKQYGFEQIGDDPESVGSLGPYIRVERYEADELSETEIDTISLRIKDAHKASTGRTTEWFPSPITPGIYTLEVGDTYQSITRIRLIVKGSRVAPSGGQMRVLILVVRPPNPSILDRIKDWLPW